MDLDATPDAALATNGDLFAVLARLASSDRRSSGSRGRQQLAMQAIDNLFPIAEKPTAAAPIPAASPVPPATQTNSSGRGLPPAPKLFLAPAIRPVIVPRSKQRRCDCGLCQRCKDNARWDRIFNEKFADPTYYSSVVIRRSSTLAPPR
jgi:hypothetical protein